MIILNLILSSMLTCLIWIVQILHYPSFKFVDKNHFVEFEAFHTKSISFIVLPLMLLEITVSSLLLYQNPRSVLTLGSCLLLAFIWGTTFLVSVPCHNILSTGFDLTTIEKLVSTNWIRTISWSMKMILSIYLYIGVTYE